jgi:hypothetical protein
LKNSFGQLENHYFKNTDLIERSTIDDRSSVDGSKTPEIRLGEVLKEFFNTIRPLQTVAGYLIPYAASVYFFEYRTAASYTKASTTGPIMNAKINAKLTPKLFDPKTFRVTSV